MLCSCGAKLRERIRNESDIEDPAVGSPRRGDHQWLGHCGGLRSWVSQLAVSRLLSNPEKSLGIQLFVRREGRLAPTQEIRYLQPSVERVLELARQISDVSQDITKRKARDIRVACLPGFATIHLPSVVASLLKDRPGVIMTIESDRPGRNLKWMIGEQSNFGISDGFYGRYPTVESRNIDVRTVCVFPTGHESEHLSKVTSADLADDKIVHTRRDSGFFGGVSKAFQNANVELNSHIEVRQFTAACELAI